MTEHENNFWLKDPSILFTDLKFLPSQKMSKDDKLNALTRLSFVITLVLFIAGYQYWFTFLAIAIAIILILKYSGKDGRDVKENFTLTPTYQGLDLEQTTVAPLFSEEWQVYPPSYDIYESTAVPTTFEEPLNPQSYPYGQYLTRTNLLPNDEYYTHMLNGGTKNAREYANSAFTRNTIAFRDNISKIYKQKLQRRFQMNCNDTFSSFSGY